MFLCFICQVPFLSLIFSLLICWVQDRLKICFSSLEGIYDLVLESSFDTSIPPNLWCPCIGKMPTGQCDGSELGSFRFIPWLFSASNLSQLPAVSHALCQLVSCWVRPIGSTVRSLEGGRKGETSVFLPLFFCLRHYSQQQLFILPGSISCWTNLPQNQP